MSGNTQPEALAGSAGRATQALADYARVAAARGATAARTALLQALAGQRQDAWLECGRALVLRGDIDAARELFAAAVAAHPDSIELRHALAGVLWQANRSSAAEAVLRELLATHPDNAAASFLLARLLKEQGRMQAVEVAITSLFEHAQASSEDVIRAVELLDDCGRKRAAAEVVERAIAGGSTDARLHAYAGMLDMQLGQFDRARERYAFALDHDARALDWQSAYGLAASTRYLDGQHADFERFHSYLQRPALSASARASVLFALAKASDDIADYAQAAQFLHEANGLINATVDWSRKTWRRRVSARLDAAPHSQTVAPFADFAPIFIVGLPRSGTTLLAELLSRHVDVCNRGEMTWLSHVAHRVALGHDDRPTAAATYRMQVRQDDSDARWFIDKQPLNFLHVDLIANLFPNAKILWCRRNSRDTALSIWLQYFAGPENNFAYDFDNIAAVAQGAERLLAAARKKHAPMIREVRYETLVDNAQGSAGDIAQWIGLPPLQPGAQRAESSIISTSSAWQARQPVYRSSIGRWHAYAPFVPQLLEVADD